MNPCQEVPPNSRFLTISFYLVPSQDLHILSPLYEFLQLDVLPWNFCQPISFIFQPSSRSKVFQCTRVRRSCSGPEFCYQLVVGSWASLQKRESKVTSPVTAEHMKLFQFLRLLQNVQSSSLQVASVPEMAHPITHIINTFLLWMRTLCFSGLNPHEH